MRLERHMPGLIHVAHCINTPPTNAQLLHAPFLQSTRQYTSWERSANYSSLFWSILDDTIGIYSTPPYLLTPSAKQVLNRLQFSVFCALLKPP